MRCAIISLGSVSSQWTSKALRNYFDTVDDIDIRHIEINLGEKGGEILSEGKPLKEYDCIYVKGSFRYAQIAQSIVTLLPSFTYTPIVANAFNLGHDKLLTQLELQTKSIPMPKTYQAASVQAARKILERMNYPIIMKFPRGTQGKGVLVADSFGSASSMLDALETLRQPFLIQEYVDTGGVDIRAVVVGGKVVATMKRKSSAGEIRANLHAGGAGEAIELDSKTKKIAIQTAKAIGADICAVDMLESHKGTVVIEVNLSPGLQGITEVTQSDVADKIAKFLYKSTTESKEGLTKSNVGKVLDDLGIANATANNILAAIDLRSNRILLPEFITKISGLENGDDVVIDAETGLIKIRKGLS